MTGQVIESNAFHKNSGSPPDSEEWHWVEQLKQGQQQALRPLYERYGKKVYALSYRLSSDAEVAEDITQEVFVQVWQKIHNFKGESKFSTWLYSVTSHVAINHMRKQKRWWQSWFVKSDESMATEIIENVPTSDEQSDFTLSRSGLDKHIAALPQQARIVFVLFAIQGWRHEEISKELNIAIGSSKAQYHRAKQLLQMSLHQEEIDSGVVA